MLALIRSAGHLNVLADICLAVLLFMIGLKLDLHVIRSPGRISAATGLGQVVFTASAGFAICLALGTDLLTSVYVAVASRFTNCVAGERLQVSEGYCLGSA